MKDKIPIKYNISEKKKSGFFLVYFTWRLIILQYNNCKILQGGLQGDLYVKKNVEYLLANLSQCIVSLHSALDPLHKKVKYLFKWTWLWSILHFK